MRCAICYHLYNIKYVENTHEGVLLFVKLTKSNARPRVFFTFFKLGKWYQIVQRITYKIQILYDTVIQIEKALINDRLCVSKIF